LGLDQDEIIGRPVWDVLGQNAYEEISGYIDQALSGVTAKFETVLTFNNGEQRWVEASYIPRFSAEGLVEGFFSLIQDISDRKKAEETLRLTQFAIENAGDAALWLLHGKIVYANRKAIELSGYEPSELLDLYDYDVIPELLAEGWEHLWDDIKAQGAKTFEARSKTKDGRYFLTEITAKYLQFENKEYCIAFGRDVTERKQYEEMLRVGNERLDLAIDTAQLAIWDWNPQTNELYFNKKWADILGFETIESPLTLARILEFLHPDQETNAMELLENIRSGRVDSGESVFQIKNKQGQYINMHTRVKTVSWDGDKKPVRVIVVGRDITEEKKAEQTIINYQNRLKSLTSRLIKAGDMERTQIAQELHDGICQYLAMAKMHLSVFSENEPQGQRLELLEKIQNTIHTAYQQARSLTFDLYPPILNELGLAAAILQIIENLRAETGMNITLADVGSDITLKRNSRRFIFRMVKELLNNAKKHSRASNVHVNIIKNTERWIVSVADNGVGFNPSFDYPASDHPVGFGLFSIREQLDGIGGAIEIESSPGNGTKVVLNIPIEREDIAV